MPDVQLDEGEFRERFLSQFIDPAFAPLKSELDKVAGAAWDGYSNGRKSPRTHKAGPQFADPDYDLADDWRATKHAIDAARNEYEDPSQPPCILIVNGSSRSEHTCPGEMSKSWRLTQIARETCEREGMMVRILNLSRLASEYGTRIHPCKACFSTAAALCHWPCSCYPNYSLGQTQDLMNSIYPLWVRAHGIMLITPVNWYHTSSPMKLMIDRLVCADGGNPDPTTTHGKDAKRAKQLELDGLALSRTSKAAVLGRAFMATSKAPRTCAGAVRLAALHAPGTRRVPAGSTATSAIWSPMPRAMRRSTRTAIQDESAMSRQDPVRSGAGAESGQAYQSR